MVATDGDYLLVVFQNRSYTIEQKKEKLMAVPFTQSQ
jgi:hypothetical protein